MGGGDTVCADLFDDNGLFYADLCDGLSLYVLSMDVEL